MVECPRVAQNEWQAARHQHSIRVRMRERSANEERGEAGRGACGR